MATEIQVLTEDGIGIIHTEGYIDTEGGDAIVVECKKLIEKEIYRIVINLEKSNLINSMGIMCLLEAGDAARDAGGGVCFCCVTPTMEKTFRIMGVVEVAGVCGTQEEARETLARE